MENLTVLLDRDVLETYGETFHHLATGVGLDVTAAKA